MGAASILLAKVFFISIHQSAYAIVKPRWFYKRDGFLYMQESDGKSFSNESLILGDYEPSECDVVFLSRYGDAADPRNPEMPLNLRSFQAVFTDSHDLVDYARVKDRFHFIDNTTYPEIMFDNFAEMKAVAQDGERKVSFLFPAPIMTDPDGQKRENPVAAHPMILSLFEEAVELFPDDVYLDDGTFESRKPAFENYTFSLLMGMMPMFEELPAQALIDCVAYSTVPVLLWYPDDSNKNAEGLSGHALRRQQGKQYMDYCYYYKYSVAKFKIPDFTPAGAVHHLQRGLHKDAAFVMQNTVKLVQDFFYMRYKVPFETRIHREAEAVCRLQSEEPNMIPFVFFIILSGKTNWNQRQALRDTWLKMLDDVPREGVDAEQLQYMAPEERVDKVHRGAYKFFVNRVGITESELDGDDKEAAEKADRLLQAEAEMFGDIVFVDVPPEYPIGRQGMAAFQWVAKNTAAPYVFKVDDDVYIRPTPFFRALEKRPRSMLYQGAFDYSGEVHREEESAHFLDSSAFRSDVFPPYARGAGLVISLDLVKLFVARDRDGMLKRLRVEDASYGFYLYQVMEAGLTGVTLDDSLEENFAMDPKCCTEETHPNNCWSPLTDKSWLIHHMNPPQIACMWINDSNHGYYRKRPRNVEEPRNTKELIKQAWKMNFGGAPKESPMEFDGFEYTQIETDVLPNLCGCVHTPDPHSDHPAPSMTVGMEETPDGPRMTGFHRIHKRDLFGDSLEMKFAERVSQ